MSLYNMLHGVSSVADEVWNWLELDDWEIYRYRDAYFSEDFTNIIILTRTGGGNREDYEEMFDKIEKHPYYLEDRDCEWDSTYAEIVFSIPEKYKQEAEKYKLKEEKAETINQLNTTDRNIFTYNW